MSVPDLLSLLALLVTNCLVTITSLGLLTTISLNLFGAELSDSNEHVHDSITALRGWLTAVTSVIAAMFAIMVVASCVFAVIVWVLVDRQSSTSLIAEAINLLFDVRKIPLISSLALGLCCVLLFYAVCMVSNLLYVHFRWIRIRDSEAQFKQPTGS